jgi:hypothetical protein
MEIDLSNLPESAQKLIALIGLPATLRLVDAYGGCSVNLYSSDTSLDRMADIVGRDNAVILFKWHGSAPFTVPLCNQALKAVRNADILAEFDRLTMEENISARASVMRITRRFTPHIHERTVWRILKTLPKVKVAEDTRQMSLI